MVTAKIGNIASFDIGNRSVDPLEIEWYEANKRIMHKKTRSGKELVIKFLGAGQSLAAGDVLWQDEQSIVVVEIKPCDAIVIAPNSMQEMAAVCYEIGNKHLPLFYSNGEIMVPYEAPLFRLLQAGGYSLHKEVRALLHPLRTTVSPHGQAISKQSLFSKILQLTTTATDV